MRELERIEPTTEDIGRAVVYHPHVGTTERGVITSFNDHYVFVRYGSASTSQATSRRDLSWEHHSQ